jgi:hypothetical protein
VGQLRARGVMLTGRQRVNRSTFVDYDYSIDSTTIVSIPTAVLKSNLTLIPGAQLPNIPIQTLMFAVDHSFSRGFEARYTLNASAANNSKNLPAYNYSTLRFDTPAGAGRLTFTVDNLFNQYADIRGYIDEGVPLALNQYATAASYAPYIGASSTEHFGLPYRALYVNYTLSTR